MNLDEQYLVSALVKEQRTDGRKLTEFRPVSIDLNPIPKAEGSARVRFGRTDVIAGVKMSVGAPFPDKPDEGVLIVNAELSPLASPHFELGPPREESIELARVVDRGIREAKAIDVKKLCIIPKEKVWMVNVDLHIINHDGNLIDACGLAAMAALRKAHLLGYKDEVIQYEEKKGPLPIAASPIPVTVGKLNGRLFVDPTFAEEQVMETRLTVAMTEDGKICALQKGLGGAWTIEEIEAGFALAAEKNKELRKHLP